jgi:hypothetical protein
LLTISVENSQAVEVFRDGLYGKKVKFTPVIFRQSDLLMQGNAILRRETLKKRDIAWSDPLEIYG